MAQQIVWGSLVLGLCSLIHVVIIVGSMRMVRHLDVRLIELPRNVRLALLISTAFATAAFAHIVQVWIWAHILLATGALHSMEEALYFSISTYTTLGFGDVIVGEEFRVFASMEAVTGMLGFGLSTAFLVSLLGKLLPEHLR
jgi:hypothetical protein